MEYASKDLMLEAEEFVCQTKFHLTLNQKTTHDFVQGGFLIAECYTVSNG